MYTYRLGHIMHAPNMRKTIQLYTVHVLIAELK